MKISKETKVLVQYTDGGTMLLGDTVLFFADGKSCVGEYIGINRRGAMSFMVVTMEKGKVVSTQKVMNIMPRSIEWAYKMASKYGAEE